jgi:DNA phosphorothioation-dependent restriction protein DptG
MTYQLDLESIRESYNFEKGLKHNPNKRTRLLPYTTKFNETKFNFTSVIGEFIRLINRKKLSKRINTEELLSTVLNKIRFEDISQRSKCKQLLESLFLNEDHQLHIFHPQVLFYIDSNDLEIKKLAAFLFQVLWGNHYISTGIQQQPEDVVTSLLFNALPKLEDSDEKPQPYDIYTTYISEMFIIDFTWLNKNPQLFTQHIDKLIAYYYFFYVSQLSIRCEYMFSGDRNTLTPIYFNLEWESLSQSRISYENGWKRLEEPISKIFTHINCLEFLNHTKIQSETFLSYQNISTLIYELDYEQQSELEMQIDQLIQEYKNKLEDDSKWDLLSNTVTPYDNVILNKIFYFQKAIDHQFRNSSRNKPYQDYQKSFVYFCRKTFLKSRGRLGNTLNLNADYLLFFIKLIIKDEQKVRLKRLFDEFENRGIVFDRDSQTAIVEYLEAINILEKKSDSGDAIYVKAFL